MSPFGHLIFLTHSVSDSLRGIFDVYEREISRSWFPDDDEVVMIFDPETGTAMVSKFKITTGYRFPKHG